MISCRNVAKLLLSDELSGLGWWRRMEVRMHLSMCDHCSRLARQIRQLRSAARQMRDRKEPDDRELEDRLIRRLSGRN